VLVVSSHVGVRVSSHTLDGVVVALASDDDRWPATPRDLLFPVHVVGALFRRKLLASAQEPINRADFSRSVLSNIRFRDGSPASSRADYCLCHIFPHKAAPPDRGTSSPP
jgi:hypothetical protein